MVSHGTTCNALNISTFKYEEIGKIGMGTMRNLTILVPFLNGKSLELLSLKDILIKIYLCISKNLEKNESRFPQKY